MSVELLHTPDLVAAPARTSVENSAFVEERSWRRPPAGLTPGGISQQVLVTRWREGQGAAHRQSAPATDCFVVALCLEPVTVRIKRVGAGAYEGALAPGAMYLIRAGEALVAEFDGACDFLHIYLPLAAWRQRTAEFWGSEAPERVRKINIVRDGLAEQLARSLMKASDAGRRAYGEAVGNTIVARYLLLTRVTRGSAHALQQWRLRRVQAHIEENLSEPLRLSELAAVAGLSRMHFAALFRAATGYRPHEYLLWRRIEKAKAMLRLAELPVVQVALDVGFQAQSHFTTVFKRLTGFTPANWRISQRSEMVPS